MKSIVRGGALIAGAMMMLTGCAGVDPKRDGGPVPVTNGVVDGAAMLGAPFTIGGVIYTPADIPDYDDVGYAGVYGDERAGQPTANGESFDPAGISAAHKTLPLPSYVEVTALDTGRTILVRVNDRGPMVNDRLIDLSLGAAEQLGLTGGTAAVRVRRTNPPSSEKAQLRAGKPAVERIATPDSLLAILRNKMKALPVPTNASTEVVGAHPGAPIASGKVKPGADRFIVEASGTKPAPTAKPAAPVAAKPTPAASGNHIVQVGAFSSEARANAAAKSVGGTVSKAGSMWRVRIGPFASDADARAALGKAKAKGFGDAVIMRNR